MLRRFAVAPHKPIVVVGSINTDLVAVAERIPVTGETIPGKEFQIHPGGKGANQAVAIARLGYPVRMIGKLGSDSFAGSLRTHLESAGVDTAAISTVEGSTGVAVIIVSTSGDNLIVVTSGANAMLAPSDIDANLDMIRQAGVVLTQLEIPSATVEHLGRVCAREGIPLMLDPAPATDLPPGLVGQATWFTPNETEADFYAGGSRGESPKNIARILLNQGWPGVVLKLGANGAYVADRAGLERQVPSVSVHVLDTTAAGDTFNGAFATGIMLGMKITDSAKFAAAAAAISVSRPGAQPSMPTMDEVQTLLQEQGATTC
jgi:ribokinase